MNKYEYTIISNPRSSMTPKLDKKKILYHTHYYKK